MACTVTALSGQDEGIVPDMGPELATAIAAQSEINVGMWESMQELGMQEGDVIDASLMWQCSREQDAAKLVTALQELLLRVQLVPRPKPGDPRRELGWFVQGNQRVELSLARLHELTETMILLGAKHDAKFSSCGFMRRTTPTLQATLDATARRPSSV